ncbi:hypothetical protein RI367_005499 [Sorochytrium milnesiophthora]
MSVQPTPTLPPLSATAVDLKEQLATAVDRSQAWLLSTALNRHTKRLYYHYDADRNVRKLRHAPIAELGATRDIIRAHQAAGRDEQDAAYRQLVSATVHHYLSLLVNISGDDTQPSLILDERGLQEPALVTHNARLLQILLLLSPTSSPQSSRADVDNYLKQYNDSAVTLDDVIHGLATALLESQQPSGAVNVSLLQSYPLFYPQYDRSLDFYPAADTLLALAEYAQYLVSTLGDQARAQNVLDAVLRGAQYYATQFYAAPDDAEGPDQFIFFATFLASLANTLHNVLVHARTAKMTLPSDTAATAWLARAIDMASGTWDNILSSGFFSHMDASPGVYTTQELAQSLLGLSQLAVYLQQQSGTASAGAAQLEKQVRLARYTAAIRQLARALVNAQSLHPGQSLGGFPLSTAPPNKVSTTASRPARGVFQVDLVASVLHSLRAASLVL